MFPLGPDGGQEPDVIGTAHADRGPPRWRRYLTAGGMLALAGIVAATVLVPHGHPAAAPKPSASPTPAPVAAVTPVPVIVPPTAGWAGSLGIAIWPMPGDQGPGGTMFAGGGAGKQGWMLTLRSSPRPGHRCVAEVMLNETKAYPVPDRPAMRTPVGDLAFMALGAGAPGVGVAILQIAAPATQAVADSDRIGGLQINVPAVAETACGKTYYLAGFAYPLAGTLDITVTTSGRGSADYLVPARLSRPRTPGVWESTG